MSDFINAKIIQQYHNKLTVKKIRKLDNPFYGDLTKQNHHKKLAELALTFNNYTADEFNENIKNETDRYNNIVINNEEYKRKFKAAQQWMFFICPHEFHECYDEENDCVFCGLRDYHVTNCKNGHFIEQINDTNIYVCKVCGERHEKPDCLGELLQ
ncbi:MAG: hypothetical protein ABWZ79_05930 [Pedobacter agri]